MMFLPMLNVVIPIQNQDHTPVKQTWIPLNMIFFNFKLKIQKRKTKTIEQCYSYTL